MTARNPSEVLAFSSLVEDICVKATPIVSISKDAHLTEVR
jgi:hypothetical protein